MAGNQAKGYEIKELSIQFGESSNPDEEVTKQAFASGEKYDIKQMCLGFQYFESIDSPFRRVDLHISDAVDMNKSLRGDEVIRIKLRSESAKPDGKDGFLEFAAKVFKIGNVSKRERAQVYTLHCVSPEMYNNEVNRVFKSFGGKGGSAADVVKTCLDDYLLAGKKYQPDNIEDTSPIQFISPSWRPLDVIAYTTDKITRSSGSGGGKGGKASDKQSGFLFFENKFGFNYKSIDRIVEEGKNTSKPPEYTYYQSATSDNFTVNNYYTIESVQFPDKIDHITQIRSGAYASMASGVLLPEVTKSALTASGGGDTTSPQGTAITPRGLAMTQVFEKATTVESEFPIPNATPYMFKSDGTDEPRTSRQKFRILPSFKNQQQPTGDPSNGAPEADLDTLGVSEYAMARFRLLTVIKLSIQIPGNTSLYAGQTIKVKIPAASVGERKVKEDRIYSGRYVILGLTHEYSPEGVVTKLSLCRDSVRKDK